MRYESMIVITNTLLALQVFVMSFAFVHTSYHYSGIDQCAFYRYDASNYYPLAYPLDHFSNGRLCTAYTIEFWVKPNRRALMEILSVPRITMNVSDNFIFMSFSLPCQNSTFVQLFSGTAALINSWTHFAVTWSSNLPTLVFVNGSSVWEAVNPAIYQCILDGTYPRVFIGGSSTSGNVFYGGLDEIKIWNERRPLAQISAGIAVPSSITPAKATSLIGGLLIWFSFDECSCSETHNLGSRAALPLCLSGEMISPTECQMESKFGCSLTLVVPKLNATANTNSTASGCTFVGNDEGSSVFEVPDFSMPENMSITFWARPSPFYTYGEELAKWIMVSHSSNGIHIVNNDQNQIFAIYLTKASGSNLAFLTAEVRGGNLGSWSTVTEGVPAVILSLPMLAVADSWMYIEFHAFTEGLNTTKLILKVKDAAGSTFVVENSTSAIYPWLAAATFTVGSQYLVTPLIRKSGKKQHAFRGQIDNVAVLENLRPYSLWMFDECGCGDESVVKDFYGRFDGILHNMPCAFDTHYESIRTHGISENGNGEPSGCAFASDFGDMSRVYVPDFTLSGIPLTIELWALDTDHAPTSGERTRHPTLFSYGSNGASSERCFSGAFRVSMFTYNGSFVVSPSYSLYRDGHIIFTGVGSARDAAISALLCESSNYSIVINVNVGEIMYLSITAQMGRDSFVVIWQGNQCGGAAPNFGFRNQTSNPFGLYATKSSNWRYARAGDSGNATCAFKLQNNANACTSMACYNGYCSSSSGRDKCICMRGYHGSNCASADGGPSQFALRSDLSFDYKHKFYSNSGGGLVRQKWTHIAFRIDNSGTTSFLVNGINAGTQSYQLTTDPFSQGVGVLLIGYKTTGPTALDYDVSTDFLGFIDEFRVWTVVRSDNDVKRWMRRDLSLFPQSGLLSYFKFNECLCVPAKNFSSWELASAQLYEYGQELANCVQVQPSFTPRVIDMRCANGPEPAGCNFNSRSAPWLSAKAENSLPSRFQIPDFPFPAPNFTIEIWVDMWSEAEVSTVWSYLAADGTLSFLDISGSGDLFLTFHGSQIVLSPTTVMSTEYFDITSSKAGHLLEGSRLVQAGRWEHLAVVAQVGGGNTTQAQANFFVLVNGVPVRRGSIKASTATIAGYGILFIGVRGNASYYSPAVQEYFDPFDSHFEGRFDELRLWTEFRDALTIKESMRQSLSRTGFIPPNLFANYKFDECRCRTDDGTPANADGIGFSDVSGPLIEVPVGIQAPPGYHYAGWCDAQLSQGIRVADQCAYTNPSWSSSPLVTVVPTVKAGFAIDFWVFVDPTVASGSANLSKVGTMQMTQVMFYVSLISTKGGVTFRLVGASVYPSYFYVDGNILRWTHVTLNYSPNGTVCMIVDAMFWKMVCTNAGGASDSRQIVASVIEITRDMAVAVDDFRIWSSVLPASKIMSAASRTLWLFEQDIVSHFRFNGCGELSANSSYCFVSPDYLMDSGPNRASLFDSSGVLNSITNGYFTACPNYIAGVDFLDGPIEFEGNIAAGRRSSVDVSYSQSTDVYFTTSAVRNWTLPFVLYRDGFLFPQSEFTLSVWIKPASITATSYVVSYGAAYAGDMTGAVTKAFRADEFSLIISGQDLHFYVHDIALGSGGKLVGLSWHYVSFSWTQKGQFSVYIDGAVKIPFSAVDSRLSLSLSRPGYLMLGAKPISYNTNIPNVSTFFAGDLGSFRLWSNVISDALIRNSMYWDGSNGGGLPFLRSIMVQQPNWFENGGVGIFSSSVSQQIAAQTPSRIFNMGRECVPVDGSLAFDSSTVPNLAPDTSDNLFGEDLNSVQAMFRICRSFWSLQRLSQASPVCSLSVSPSGQTKFSYNSLISVGRQSATVQILLKPMGSKPQLEKFIIMDYGSINGTASTTCLGIQHTVTDGIVIRTRGILLGQYTSATWRTGVFLNPREWSFITITFSISSRAICVYIGAMKRLCGSDESLSRGNLVAPGFLLIGAPLAPLSEVPFEGETKSPFMGQLSLFRMWNRFFTQSDVAETVSTFILQSSPDLLVDWNFNNCTLCGGGDHSFSLRQGTRCENFGGMDECLMCNCYWYSGGEYPLSPGCYSRSAALLITSGEEAMDNIAEFCVLSRSIPDPGGLISVGLPDRTDHGWVLNVTNAQCTTSDYADESLCSVATSIKNVSFFNSRFTTLGLSVSSIPLGCGSSGQIVGSRNVSSPATWYEFVGNGHLVTISLCQSEAAWDSALSIFLLKEGESCGELSQRHCAASANGGPGCGEHAVLTLRTELGSKYLVAVHGGTDGSQGPFHFLTSSCIDPVCDVDGSCLPCIVSDADGRKRFSRYTTHVDVTNATSHGPSLNSSEGILPPYVNIPVVPRCHYCSNELAFAEISISEPAASKNRYSIKLGPSLFLDIDIRYNFFYPEYEEYNYSSKNENAFLSDPSCYSAQKAADVNAPQCAQDLFPFCAYPIPYKYVYTLPFFDQGRAEKNHTIPRKNINSTFSCSIDPELLASQSSECQRLASTMRSTFESSVPCNCSTQTFGISCDYSSAYAPPLPVLNANGDVLPWTLPCDSVPEIFNQTINYTLLSGLDCSSSSTLSSEQYEQCIANGCLSPEWLPVGQVPIFNISACHYRLKNASCAFRFLEMNFTVRVGTIVISSLRSYNMSILGYNATFDILGSDGWLSAVTSSVQSVIAKLSGEKVPPVFACPFSLGNQPTSVTVEVEPTDVPPTEFLLLRFKSDAFQSPSYGSSRTGSFPFSPFSKNSNDWMNSVVASESQEIQSSIQNIFEVLKMGTASAAANVFGSCPGFPYDNNIANLIESADNFSSLKDICRSPIIVNDSQRGMNYHVLKGKRVAGSPTKFATLKIPFNGSILSDVIPQVILDSSYLVANVDIVSPKMHSWADLLAVTPVVNGIRAAMDNRTSYSVPLTIQSLVNGSVTMSQLSTEAENDLVFSNGGNGTVLISFTIGGIGIPSKSTGFRYVTVSLNHGKIPVAKYDILLNAETNWRFFVNFSVAISEVDVQYLASVIAAESYRIFKSSNISGVRANASSSPARLVSEEASDNYLAALNASAQATTTPFPPLPYNSSNYTVSFTAVNGSVVMPDNSSMKRFIVREVPLRKPQLGLMRDVSMSHMRRLEKGHNPARLASTEDALLYLLRRGLLRTEWIESIGATLHKISNEHEWNGVDQSMPRFFAAIKEKALTNGFRLSSTKESFSPNLSKRSCGGDSVLAGDLDSIVMSVVSRWASLRFTVTLEDVTSKFNVAAGGSALEYGSSLYNEIHGVDKGPDSSIVNLFIFIGSVPVAICIIYLLARAWSKHKERSLKRSLMKHNKLKEFDDKGKKIVYEEAQRSGFRKRNWIPICTYIIFEIAKWAVFSVTAFLSLWWWMNNEHVQVIRYFPAFAKNLSTENANLIRCFNLYQNEENTRQQKLWNSESQFCDSSMLSLENDSNVLQQSVSLYHKNEMTRRNISRLRSQVGSNWVNAQVESNEKLQSEAEKSAVKFQQQAQEVYSTVQAWRAQYESATKQAWGKVDDVFIDLQENHESVVRELESMRSDVSSAIDRVRPPFEVCVDLAEKLPGTILGIDVPYVHPVQVALASMENSVSGAEGEGTELNGVNLQSMLYNNYSSVPEKKWLTNDTMSEPSGVNLPNLNINLSGIPSVPSTIAESAPLSLPPLPPMPDLNVGFDISGFLPEIDLDFGVLLPSFSFAFAITASFDFIRLIVKIIQKGKVVAQMLRGSDVIIRLYDADENVGKVRKMKNCFASLCCTWIPEKFLALGRCLAMATREENIVRYFVLFCKFTVLAAIAAASIFLWYLVYEIASQLLTVEAAEGVGVISLLVSPVTAALATANLRISANAASINSVQLPYYVSKMNYRRSTMKDVLNGFNKQQSGSLKSFNDEYCQLQGQLGQPICRNMVVQIYAVMNFTECVPVPVDAIAFTGFDRKNYENDVKVNIQQYIYALQQLVLNTLLLPLYLAALYISIEFFWIVLRSVFRRFHLLRENRLYTVMYDPRDHRNEKFIIEAATKATDNMDKRSKTSVVVIGQEDEASGTVTAGGRAEQEDTPHNNEKSGSSRRLKVQQTDSRRDPRSTAIVRRSSSSRRKHSRRLLTNT